MTAAAFQRRAEECTLDDLAARLGYQRFTLLDDDSPPSLSHLKNDRGRYAEIARNIGLLVEQNVEPRNYGALIRVGITHKPLEGQTFSTSHSNIDFFELRRTLHEEDSRKLMRTFLEWAKASYEERYVYWQGLGGNPLPPAIKSDPVRAREVAKSVRERVYGDLGSLSYRYQGQLIVVLREDDGRTIVGNLSLYDH